MTVTEAIIPGTRGRGTLGVASVPGRVSDGDLRDIEVSTRAIRGQHLVVNLGGLSWGGHRRRQGVVGLPRIEPGHSRRSAHGLRDRLGVTARRRVHRRPQYHRLTHRGLPARPPAIQHHHPVLREVQLRPQHLNRPLLLLRHHPAGPDLRPPRHRHLPHLAPKSAGLRARGRRLLVKRPPRGGRGPGVVQGCRVQGGEDAQGLTVQHSDTADPGVAPGMVGTDLSRSTHIESRPSPNDIPRILLEPPPRGPRRPGGLGVVRPGPQVAVAVRAQAPLAALELAVVFAEGRLPLGYRHAVLVGHGLGVVGSG
mmetsp:Transcript_57626/g.132955  ORF Transcript_57626/g.132955 Transcript_57626/m.132955 type:complete len:310 (+) Transcript_57626:637-1566(+)